MRARDAVLPFLLALAAGPSTAAAGGAPAGEFDGPVGRVRISGDGTTFRGTLVAPAVACGLRAGDEVLRATLLDDSLAGELRVCLAGKRCAAREGWANAVLLVGADRLSGAVHVREPGCAARGAAKGGGVTFTARAPAAAAPRAATPAPATDRRERARALLRDGAAWLHEGAFERARERFLEAIAIDPRVPEAYNGVGVTYRMRNDLPEALAWYKQALGVDPDLGDAYYNMACVYALEGKKDLALRYLQIAALNGYASAEGIDADPDLASLREEPAYRALLRTRL